MRLLFRVGLVVALVFGFAPLSRAEKPFSFTDTPGKLPKTVVPKEYSVRVVPNITARKFTGSESVKLDVREPVRQLVLNAADVTITAALLDGQAIPSATIQTDAKMETATIPLDREVPAGEHTLSLEFAGKINERGQGLYAAEYQEEGSGAKKTMLGTQFEATDARRFFPCWDEPSFRARFQLTAVVPENFMAVSNMPIEKETKTPNGKELRFGMTPPMASYLNVFVAGELDSIESKVGPTTVRVIATKGKAERGRYALESTAQILSYYNEYFGVPYPLPKLDQIAVPGGFGGAMENWGGITYYESALLFDPKNSSTETKQNIFAVIAHEMAHQWFGDLVTMAWWDNLWLNEGFASWMGSKCTAKFNPQWEVWLRSSTPRDPSRRHGMPKETAMEGDARSTTHPIQQTINTEAEANSAFDDITYKKGQSFIRMMESFLGNDVFRDGIRRYMAAHKFSNSTTTDLWNALGEASGKPVSEIAAGWTQQPGFPLVTIARGDHETVTFTQEPFTIHNAKPPTTEWQIPLTMIRPGEPAPTSKLMTGKTMEVAGVADDRALKVNVEGAGNYRVSYDKKSWDLLLRDIATLTPADRVNLLADTWALVQANRAPLSRYAEVVTKLPATLELAEREQVIGVFDFINRLIANDPQRGAFQVAARAVLRPTFDQLGWEPRAGEPPQNATLRASLINALGTLNDKEIIDGCRARFAKFVVNRESLVPDLRPAVLAVVGRYADEATWNQLHDLGLKTTSIEEKQYLYDAMAGALDPKLAEKTLQIALGNEVPTSRAVFLVSKVARQSEHPEIVWAFAKAHMKELLAKTDALGANSYVPSLFTFFADEARVTELQEFAKTGLPPAAAKDVGKAVDELEFRAEFRKRLLAQLPGVFGSPDAAAGK